MGTNAYTNLTPAKFNPLSLQEIMMVPLARQQAHDQSQAQMAELAMFDTKRLAKDDEEARRLHADYMGRVNEAEDSLLTKGYSSGIAKNVLDLKRDRQQAMSQDGWHGKMENAYTQDKALEDYFKKNKDITPVDAQKYLDYSRRRYSGYEDGYKPYYGANTVNGMDIATKFAKEITPQTLENIDKDTLKIMGGQWGIQDVGEVRAFIKNNYKTIINDPKKNQILIAAALEADTGFNDYLDAQVESQGMEDGGKYKTDTINYYSAIAAQQKSQNDASYSQDLRNLPSEGGSEKGTAFGKSGVLAYDHKTRTIFEDSTTSKDIVKKYEDLLKSDNPQEIAEGNRMKNHYERAIDKFKSTYPEIIKSREALTNSKLHSVAGKMGIDIESAVELGTRSNYGAGNTYLKREGDGYGLYTREYGLNQAGTNSSLNHVKKATITASEFDTLKQEAGKFKQVNNEYNAELNNYLNQYADNTRSYILTDLKDTDNNKIDRDITKIIIAKPEANISIQSASKGGKEVFNADAEKILTEVKNGLYDTELISFTGENEKGLPEMKLRYSDKKGENSGFVSIMLDDLYTAGSLSKSVNNYVMDKYEQHGGTEGKIIAARARDRIKYKNIIPNSKVDFKESDQIKQHISPAINKALDSKLQDYKMDLISTKNSDGEMEYTMQIGDKDNSQSGTLTWNMIFESPEDFLKIGTTTIARHLYNDIVKDLNKDIEDISPKELTEYLRKMISEEKIIKTNDYRDLLNLLSN